MAKITFKRDSAGIRRLLQEHPGVRREIDAAARRVASAAGGEVAGYTTDRAAAAVSVKASEQAKRGVLTRAAAAAGLEVTTRDPGW